MACGSTRPFNFWGEGPRPGPARPDLSNFLDADPRFHPTQITFSYCHDPARPGPARPISFFKFSTRHITF